MTPHQEKSRPVAGAAKHYGNRGCEFNSRPYYRAIHPAVEVERARSALWAIPSDGPGHQWVKVIAAALKEGVSPDQLQAWSEQDQRFDLREFRQALQSATKMRRVGGASLYWIAAQYGWRDDSQRARPSRDEIQRLRAAQAELKARQEHDRVLEMLRASRDAAVQLRTAEPRGPNAYLVRKHVEDACVLTRLDPQNRLVVPLVDELGIHWSNQTIDPAGRKRFTRGGRVGGCFNLLPGRLDSMFLCEGFATAAALWLATDATVVATMSANNLARVAQALLHVGRVPADVLVVADNDASRTGEHAARQAASVLGCAWVMPSKVGTDAADVWADGGRDAVLDLIDGVLA